MVDIAHKRESLLQELRSYGSCLVAMSAGVDSSVVAKAAQLALGECAIAVTGVSASLAAGELESAQDIAKLIGIRHEVIGTREQSSVLYRQNGPDRCYHCKTELYTRLESLAAEWGLAVIANGVNFDDLHDFRPGLRAAEEHRVRSPLVDCQIGKAELRQLARDWGLPVWDRPASPCLASRVAYGQEVTPERLQQIDLAETYVRGLGLREVRVRYHAGDVARLEVSAEHLGRLCEPSTRRQLVTYLKQLGFKFVTLDLEGFRSGSLNDLIPADSLRLL